MAIYTFSDIVGLLNGKMLQQVSDPEVDVLLTDSRKLVQPSSTIFFTIHGRRDANRFVEDVYQKGCRCFVVDHSFKFAHLYAEGNFVQVENTLSSLQLLVARHRSKFSLPVIGITGSNGKTIVKEWLDQLLHETFNIVKSPKSYNSQVGVPLSVWQLTETHNLGIFEAGISATGEMARLEKIIHPTIGLVTSIGDAHAAGFASLEEKVREKLNLFIHAGLLIFCSDSFVLQEQVNEYLLAQNPQLKSFTWGKHGEPDLFIQNVERIGNATSITCRKDNSHFEFRIPFTDSASVENAISCCAALICLEVPLDEIQEKFHHLRSVEMRLELKHGINDCSVINDSYSSDMHSLGIALDFLEQQKQHSKRTIILSDFMQQEQDANRLYAKVSALLQRRKISRLVGIGKVIGNHQQAFDGIPQTEFYPDTETFLSNFTPGSFAHETILLKGARKYAFERISYLLEERTHESVLEIDLNAIRHNLKFFLNRLSPGVKMMVMVKAFSYGTGSFEIAGILENAGADYLAVAYADEGIELRRAGIRLPVMVMNTEEAGFENLVKYELEPELYSFKITNAFIAFLEARKITNYPVHIKLDTGMHRLGFESSDMGNLAQLLKESVQIKVASIFSHLAGSDEQKLDDFTNQQAASFTAMCKLLEEAIGYDTIKHIGNSSAIVRHPTLQLNMVRLGIGLYGVDNNEEIQRKLQHVATLKTTISQIRTVKAGESVGYNRSGMVDVDTSVATVRIGYADGYPRSLGNGKGQMLINGKYARVLGNVCMDMTMLDISGIDAREGDSVIVFGEHPSVTDLAGWAGTIAYEMLTGVSQRVKRVYFNE